MPHQTDRPSYLFALGELPTPMVFAAHRVIRDCNQPFAELFGYARDELVGQSFRQLYQNVADFVAVGKLWRAHLTTGAIYADERVMRRKDGTAFWCRAHGRSNTPADPFAEALYCFEPMQRGVVPSDHKLTYRQREILMLVSRGLSNERVAVELGLSRRTVEAHRARLMKSVGVHNAAGLVAWFSERDANLFQVTR
jgi:PAS domain S-box-containing protein